MPTEWTRLDNKDWRFPEQTVNARAENRNWSLSRANTNESYAFNKTEQHGGGR